MTLASLLVLPALAQHQAIEVSDDGQETVVVRESETDGRVTITRSGVPYGTAPDWENNLRVQVGGPGRRLLPLQQLPSLSRLGEPDLLQHRDGVGGEPLLGLDRRGLHR
jgi:hypothetical protein